MRKNHIKSLVLGLMFSAMFCLNVNASIDGSADTSINNGVQWRVRNLLGKVSKNKKTKAAKVQSLDKQLLKVCKERRKDCCEVAKKLLDEKANVNARGSRKNITPLMYASRGSSELVKLLIDHGADVNARNADGDTALVYASKRSCPSIVALLIANGANVENDDINKVLSFLRQTDVKDSKNKNLPHLMSETRKCIELLKVRQKIEGKNFLENKEVEKLILDSVKYHRYKSVEELLAKKDDIAVSNQKNEAELVVGNGGVIETSEDRKDENAEAPKPKVNEYNPFDDFYNTDNDFDDNYDCWF